MDGLIGNEVKFFKLKVKSFKLKVPEFLNTKVQLSNCQIIELSNCRINYIPLKSTLMAMNFNQKKPFRIAVTGPESSGKTTLVMQLADHFDARYFPEYAREYVENLNRPYNFEDVETIANFQLEQYRLSCENDDSIFIFDTWLIITKIWFKWVFNQEPEWLETEIRNHPIDLFLLCRPDLPWEADSVRENGGANRDKLFAEYRDELIRYGFRFAEIGGTGDTRLTEAIEAVNRAINN